MKALLKILLGGFVVFMLLAIAQEWSYFSSIWFPSEEEVAEAAGEEDVEAATAGLREFLSLTRHFYSSGGDPRFSDRMPAAPNVLAEMQADVAYLTANGRRQDQQLKKLEVADVLPLSPDRLEIRTREIWHTRTLRLDSEERTDPDRWQMLHNRYLLQREGSGWRVLGWEVDQAARSPEAAERQ